MQKPYDVQDWYGDLGCRLEALRQLAGRIAQDEAPLGSALFQLVEHVDAGYRAGAGVVLSGIEFPSQ